MKAESCSMNDALLIELCRLLEMPHLQCAPDAAWLSGQSQVYRRLLELEALALSPTLVPEIVCPSCGCATVQPLPNLDGERGEAPIVGLCIDCGWVDLKREEAYFWQVQIQRLLRGLAAALHLTHFVLEPILENTLWRLGEIEIRRKRRTVFFGRRLFELPTQVEAALQARVAPGAEILLTGGDPAALRNSALGSRLLVPLRAIAHLRKGGWVVENLAAYLSNTESVASSDETSLRLLHTQRVALIRGEKHKLSPQVYTFLKILLEADGDEVHKRHIAEAMGIDDENFRTADIFKRHRAVFETFVEKDRKGRYWVGAKYME